MNQLPEYWLRGPVEGVPALLQPVAHALLQCYDEIEKALKTFPDALLWEKPAGVASPAFHLEHINGVIDRLTTYAEGRQLSETQLAFLKQEGAKDDKKNKTLLLNQLKNKIENTLEKLKAFNPHEITDIRYVGRKRIESTLLGLLFHAAEHSMRHTGQLLVTVKILSEKQ